jgi:hypothetical protein
MMAPRFSIYSEDLFVLLGINHFNTAAQDADCGACGRAERALMRAGINAAGQTADNYQTSSSQIPCQLLRHLIPVGGGATRTYDRNQVTIQKSNVSANIREGWRVANLAQSLRILGLVPGKQADSGGLSLGQLLG